jgi:glycosyltransferase involved in cell wall biosynthesis
MLSEKRHAAGSEMKILYHHRTLGDGAEGIHIREMVKAFRDQGHEVKVIGPTGETPPESSRKSRMLGHVKRLIPHALYEILEISYTGYCFWKTVLAIRSFKPDFIYDRYITFNAGTVLAGKMCRIPICLEVNAPLAKERSVEQDERLAFRKIASRMERWVCSNATQTVVVSTPLKQYLESIGVPHGKCIVMPNGVDTERFAPRARDVALLDKLGIPKDDFVIGFTGILRPWHGLDLLVDAVANMARKGFKVFLLIVGDGPYRKPLEKMVNELGLGQSVCITGRIPHERVPDYVSLFDVAVSPRATFYASPMKVIEYMALGKPVVVPATPNFLDIVEDRLEGITFEEGNIVALEQALACLCKAPELRRELGFRARQKVERRLNWRWNANEVCRRLSACAIDR